MKMELNVIEIKWSGPHKLDDVKEFYNDDDYGVYQIYGTHPIFGSNTLLYIGKANSQTFSTRLIQHNDWLDWLPSDVSIHLGRLGAIKDVSIEEWEKQIDVAERLLIFYCKPPHNSSNINAFGNIEETILLNYGKTSSLPIVVTTLYETSGYVTNNEWNLFKC